MSIQSSLHHYDLYFVPFIKDGGGEDDGDAYDSGEEVQATKEDMDFIDNENDEHADLVAEYERDNPQNFNEDEIDEGFAQRSNKSSKKPTTVTSTGDRLRTRDQDPLSQVLLEMKKPKAQVRFIPACTSGID